MSLQIIYVLTTPAMRGLNVATTKVIGLKYAIQPTPNWTYEGKLLQAIDDETYQQI